MKSERRTVDPFKRVAQTGDTLTEADLSGQSQNGLPALAGGFRVQTKVWVERSDGVVLISDFRADLLERVASEGSVAAAARALGLPNRTAWKKLDEMERAAGVPLIETTSGGAAGGGATLTAAGRALLDAYRRVTGPVAADVEARFEDELPLIGDTGGTATADRDPRSS